MQTNYNFISKYFKVVTCVHLIIFEGYTIMVFQCVFTSFIDYYVNTNYNFDLFGYKIDFFGKFEKRKRIIALSKDPELPRKSCTKIL